MLYFKNLPIFIYLMAITSVIFFIPMGFALSHAQWLPARTFFYHGFFFAIITTLLAIALCNRKAYNQPIYGLINIFAAFIFLPVLMALPVDFLLTDINFSKAYFEMLSCFTTTGASLMKNSSLTMDIIHLWRALVAWFGGLLMLVIAFAIFAPMNLCGFEIYAHNYNPIFSSYGKQVDINNLMYIYTRKIFPIYAGLSCILALLLFIFGDTLLVATIHAMAILSSSGVSSIGGLHNSNAGIGGEIVIFLFLLPAFSHRIFSQVRLQHSANNIKEVSEIILALIVLGIMTLLLFFWYVPKIMHVEFLERVLTIISMIWGIIFTVWSFMSTTGFESQYWHILPSQMEISISSLMLMTVAVMGGGIATTAGGIKLLRVFILYKHGMREMQRLSFPNSVGGIGLRKRMIQRDGAYAAWAFFMLFLISLSSGMLALSAVGSDFINSFVLATAGLSNTGTLVQTIGDNGINYLETSSIRFIFCILMVLGRLETLVVIAIFNPNYWLN